MTIRLLIACVDSSVSQGISEALQGQAGEPALECEIADMGRAVSVAAVRQPDALLLQRQLAGERTLQMLLQLSQVSPDTRSLVLCDFCTTAQLVELVRHGAAGCLLSSDEAAMLAKAVRSVTAGESWFGRSALLQALRNQIGLPHIELASMAARLTHREDQILQLIGLGLSNKEIGRRLEISDQTVKTHLHRVYAKLHQSGRYKAFLSQPMPGKDAAHQPAVS